MKRQHALSLAVWTLLCVALFFPLLTGAQRLPDGDFVNQFHAFARFQASEVWAGRLPTWSPYSWGGVPFAADTQAAVFYPPRWLTILLAPSGDLSLYALEMEGLAHIWLAGILTYLLVFSITRRPIAGLLGAVAFGMGGYLTSYPLLQLAILETITWLPLALLLVREGIKRGRPVPWLVGAGLALATSALAGHPQTFLHVSYVVAAYYLFLGWRASWRVGWLIGLGGVTLAVTAGTAGVGLLPAARALPYTTRAEVSYDFIASGFGLLDYLQVLVPGVLSFWSPTYGGLATACLAGYALFRRREQGNGEIGFWAVLALIAAWLSLGDAGVLFEGVAKVAPGFSLFRHQERIVGIWSLSAAVLAGQGLAWWLGQEGEEGRATVRRVAYLLAGGLGLAAITLAVTRPESMAAWLPVWGRQCLIGAAAIGLLWGGHRRGLQASGLVLLLALDLFGPVRGAMDLQAGPPDPVWQRPGWLVELVAAEPGRVDTQGIFQANVGEALGLEDLKGISPLKPAALARFESLPRALRWQLLNVTHVLAPSQIDETLVEIDRIHASPLRGRAVEAFVYRFEGALPRAWLTYQPVLVPDDEAAFEMLWDPGFDPARQVILQEVPPGLGEIREPDAAAEVQTTRSEPGRLTIEVHTETPGVLVISEWAYPGWRARLDGEVVRLYGADAALQALMVPAGLHKIELHYGTADVTAGGIVTGLTLAASLMVAARWRPRIARRAERGRPEVVEGERRPGRARPAGLILVLVLGAFALRVPTTSVQELRGDEAFSYFVADRPGGEIVPYLIEIGETLAPFHYLALHGWIQVAGRSELALRYLSVCLGVLLLPLAYRLGRQVDGGRFGALLVWLMVPSQLLIWVGQDVRSPYVWTPALLVAATLVLVTLESERSRIPARWLWAGYVLLGAAAVYSHYGGLVGLLAHGLYLFYSPGGRRLLRAWMGATVAVGGAVAPWVVTLWPHWTAAGHLADPGAPDLAAHLVMLGRALMTGTTYSEPVARWLFLGGLALAVFGARDLIQRGRRGWAALLAGWLAGLALLLYLLRFRRAITNDYYVALAAPAWWALVAAGLLGLWQGRKWSSRAAATVGCAVCLAAAGLGVSDYYLRPTSQRTVGYREAAARLEAEERPGDILVMNAPDPALTFYLQDSTLARTIEPSDRSNSPEVTEGELAELAAGYDRLWFIPAGGASWDPENLVSRWLDYHCLHEQAVRCGRLELLAYRPVATAADVMSPADARLGDWLRLAGGYLTVNGTPAGAEGRLVVAPGARLEVTLLWEVMRTPREDYTVYVHLLDEQGALVAQHDGDPLFGTRPTTTWRPGERLLDLHPIEIAAGAAATDGIIKAGLYVRETMERQVFADGRDGVVLARIGVTGPATR